MNIEVGTVIRVKDWPGTFGERFVVRAIDTNADGDVVIAVDSDLRQRVFPMTNCFPAKERKTR